MASKTIQAKAYASCFTMYELGQKITDAANSVVKWNESVDFWTARDDIPQAQCCQRNLAHSVRYLETLTKALEIKLGQA